MTKCEERQNHINKIWSNCIQIIDVPILNNIQGHSSALNPFKLGKSREKHSELIIAAHSTQKHNIPNITRMNTNTFKKRT